MCGFSAVSIRVKEFLSGDAGLFPAAHFVVFDFVHTVYNIMRDLGFQFENVMTEQAQFFNRDQSRFFEFVKVKRNSVERFVDAVQRMVNAQFVKLSDSQDASYSGVLVRGAFGLIHRARPAVTLYAEYQRRLPLKTGATHY